jgi:hypothetical protein
MIGHAPTGRHGKVLEALREGAAADRIFRTCSDPILLFWYQDFSGAGGQNQVFMVKFGYLMFGYLMVKVGLPKGFPLMYCTRGGSRRLLLKIRPQWSEI